MGTFVSVPPQTLPEPFLGGLSRDGVATGLVGIPNWYMHSPVEMVSLDDLDRAARLLAEFYAAVTGPMDWRP